MRFHLKSSSSCHEWPLQHGFQIAVAFAEVLEMIVGVVAGLFDRSKDQDLPQGHAGLALAQVGMLGEILFHKSQCFIPKAPPSINKLQSTQDGNHPVAALLVELEL